MSPDPEIPLTKVRVALRLDRDDTDWDRVADRIAISWELAAPRRLLEAGGR